MYHLTKEIVITDIKSTPGGILSLVRMQHADVWFMSDGINPRRLLQKAMLEVNDIGGVHLIGGFTKGGFLIASTLLRVNDFPVIDSEHHYLSITFWLDENILDKNINEVFMNDLVEHTCTPVYIAHHEPGKGFFRQQHKAPNFTPPPRIHKKQTKSSIFSS